MRASMYLGSALLVALLVVAAVYRDWVWKNTDNLTKWLQIAALIVAGYWAYTRYFVGEAPSLEPLVGVEDDLRAEPNPPPQTCIVTYEVTVTNKGLVSVDVNEVKIQAWPFDLEKPGPGLNTYVDLDKVELGKPVIEKSFDSGYLNGRYPPKDARRHTFSWVLGAPTSRSYLFAVVLRDPDRKVLGSARHVTLDICRATASP